MRNSSESDCGRRRYVHHVSVPAEASAGHDGCVTNPLARLAGLLADPSRAALWGYNVRYFRDQGAKFASMFVQLPAAAELSRREVDFLFHSDLIFGSEDFVQMNLHYATEMSLGKTLSMGVKLLAGVVSGQFSWDSLRRLLDVSGRATKIRALYERFPEDPGAFEPWVREAEVLWGEV